MLLPERVHVLDGFPCYEMSREEFKLSRGVLKRFDHIVAGGASLPTARHKNCTLKPQKTAELASIRAGVPEQCPTRPRHHQTTKLCDPRKLRSTATMSMSQEGKYVDSGPENESTTTGAGAQNSVRKKLMHSASKPAGAIYEAKASIEEPTLESKHQPPETTEHKSAEAIPPL